MMTIWYKEQPGRLCYMIGFSEIWYQILRNPKDKETLSYCYSANLGFLRYLEKRIFWGLKVSSQGAKPPSHKSKTETWILSNKMIILEIEEFVIKLKQLFLKCTYSRSTYLSTIW
jgi:hypothetical protein